MLNKSKQDSGIYFLEFRILGSYFGFAFLRDSKVRIFYSPFMKIFHKVWFAKVPPPYSEIPNLSVTNGISIRKQERFSIMRLRFLV